MKLGTRIIHGGHEIDPYTKGLSTPIYQVSTFAQESVDHFGRYDYARSANPTREALEDTIAGLENGTRGFAFASGMAAISSALLLFSPGDHLVVCEDVYGGTFRVLTSLFNRLGIEATFVDTTELANIEANFRDNTRGLFLETPSNPLLKITDLAGAAALARERGIVTLVDNTFMTPYFQRPLDLGCDIVLHSGTKFLNGHSDVICGFAVVRDPELAKRIRFIQNAFGAILGPQDSWLVLRGLKTLKVRMEESQGGAIAVAAWLSQQERVTEVLYPGLADHPGHDLAKRQSSGFGAMLAFEVTDADRVPAILSGVRIFMFAESLGGVESLITFPSVQTHADIAPEVRERLGINDRLLRLSIGIEDAEDLRQDLEQVL